MCKKKITRSPSFNIHDAFSCVDVYRQGKLTINDLKNFMQKNGFHPTETELNLLNARFDRNLNGFISYHEFIDEVLPKTSLLGEKPYINTLSKAK